MSETFSPEFLIYQEWWDILHYKWYWCHLSRFVEQRSYIWWIIFPEFSLSQSLSLSILLIKLSKGKLDRFKQTIIAGGRYDGFGIESAIGISFGLSRILDLVKNKQCIENDTDKYMITSLGGIELSTNIEYMSKLEKMLKNKIIFDSSSKK